MTICQFCNIFVNSVTLLSLHNCWICLKFWCVTDWKAVLECVWYRRCPVSQKRVSLKPIDCCGCASNKECYRTDKSLPIWLSVNSVTLMLLQNCWICLKFWCVTDWKAVLECVWFRRVMQYHKSELVRMPLTVIWYRNASKECYRTDI